jgi:hypothetical protein
MAIYQQTAIEMNASVQESADIQRNNNCVSFNIAGQTFATTVKFINVMPIEEEDSLQQKYQKYHFEC